MTKKASTPALRFKGFTYTWKQRKLGELGTITTGNTPSTAVAEYYSDDGMVWVTPTDISENITYEAEKKLSKLGQQVGRVVPKNTILVTCIASIGKNTMLGNTGSFNQQINGLTPNENKYEPYFLLTESALWSAQMKKSAAAGTMQIVNRTEFSELKTWTTTLAEQKQIGSYFRNLDRLITLHQRKYDKLTNMKKSMLEKMFPKNGANVPEIRFKGFTYTWEQRKLGEAVQEVTRNDATSDAPIMMITANNGFIEQSERYAFNNAGESLKKYILLEKGELAYNHGASKLRPYGSCFTLTTSENARIPFVYHCFSADEQNSEFLSIELNGADVENQLRRIVSSGARMDGLLNISFQEYVSVSVLLPTIEEQNKIADFFKNLDNLITLHQRELEKLKNLKKACLEKMFV